MSEPDPGPIPPPDRRWRPHRLPSRTVDAITRHRLDMLELPVDAFLSHGVRRRLDLLYEHFLDRVPFENLSNNRACLEAPEEPSAWPRATDRFLRENHDRGFGGTSFTLAYALRDLFHGLGANAHCVLGRNLVTEEMHAAVVAYVDDESLLFDPALLACGPVPIRPGGVLEDPLGTLGFEAHRGASLTLMLKLRGQQMAKPLYSIVPVPARPDRFRQAWVASFCRGRCHPLRLARRVGDEIRRYSQRPGRLEVLTTHGREQHRLDDEPVEALHRLFGLDEACLRLWFQDGPRDLW